MPLDVDHPALNEAFASSYGSMLCTARRFAKLTLREASDPLGIALSYLSDVERGCRAPFSTSRTLVLAHLYGVDPLPLLIAAARERGYVEVTGDDALIERACQLAIENYRTQATSRVLEGWEATR